MAELAAAEPPPGAGHDVAAQVRAVRAVIEAAPKSRAWRLRSRIGERVKWYETPEEVRHQAARPRRGGAVRAGRSRSGRGTGRPV